LSMSMLPGQASSAVQAVYRRQRDAQKAAGEA